MYLKVSEEIKKFAENIIATKVLKKLVELKEKDPHFRQQAEKLLGIKSAETTEVEAKLVGPALWLAILSLMVTLFGQDKVRKIYDTSDEQAMEQTIVQGLKDLKTKPQSEKSLLSLIKQFVEAEIITQADADKYYAQIKDIVNTKS